jgi:signal transduction histidine kinase
MRIERHHLAWLFASATTVACFLAATVYTQNRLGRLVTLASTLELNAVPSIQYLGKAAVDLAKLDELLDELTLPAGAADSRELREEAHRGVGTLREDIDRYLALPPLPGERQLWRGLRDAVEGAARAVEAVAADDRPSITAEQQRATNAIDAASRVVLAALDFDTRQAEQIARNVQQVRATTLRAIVGLDAGASLVAMLAVWLAYRASKRHDALLQEHASVLNARVTELDTFAGRVAHDVLSPLGTIEVALALLGKSADERAQPYIDRSHRVLQRVQQLVEGLLAFARSGARPDASDRCAVDAVITMLASDLAEAAAEAGITLTVSVTAPVTVPCSIGVLTSVLQNLVRNAIKYMGPSPVRQITVRARTIGGMAHVEVADTGPGIPLELQRKIFEPFVRGSHDGVNGNGLGLATVKRLVESHGGRVGVTSAPGSGSVFWVQLPVVPPPAAAAASMAAAAERT